MIKEMFALYLTFASPVGEVELFVRELPNCDNAEEIAEEEYLKRDIDRSKLSSSGYMCIGVEHHMIRQKLIKGVPVEPKYVPVQERKCVVPMPIEVR
tara:strand:- start:12 stop:302 length:291 start_codon:yes stop_codon:yes gene_type:complete